MEEVSRCGGTPLFVLFGSSRRFSSVIFHRNAVRRLRAGRVGTESLPFRGLWTVAGTWLDRPYFGVLEVPDNVSEQAVGRVSRLLFYALPSVLRNGPGRPQAFPRPFHRFGGNGLRYSPYSAISRSTRTGMPSAERIGMCSTGLRMPDRSGWPGSTTQTGASGRRYRTSEAAG